MRATTLSTSDHTLIMGILNVTPDSFSDGDRFVDGVGGFDAAVAAGVRLAARGADIVDVGGESTRPGAAEVPASSEIGRVVPVVAALADAGIVASVDTSKAVVAEAALAAGAQIVNDVSALGDEDMAAVCAEADAGLVLMHMRGTPRTMQVAPQYDDVVMEVREYLLERAARAEAAGIHPSRVCLDPGIGFGKTGAHNLRLLAGLEVLVATGYPVLVGASRKAFLGAILEAAGQPAAPEHRDAATGATTARAVEAGAAIVRVHDVAAALQVARTADAIVRNSIDSDDGTE